MMFLGDGEGWIERGQNDNYGHRGSGDGAVGIIGDYFLQRASGEASPLAMPAFSWAGVVFVPGVRLGLRSALSEARHDWRDLFCLHDPDAYHHGLSSMKRSIAMKAVWMITVASKSWPSLEAAFMLTSKAGSGRGRVKTLDQEARLEFHSSPRLQQAQTTAGILAII